ncbi:MAG TPA: hemerythrin domain-containing protein [Candidatus Dormibacteraeota bacterium]
MPAFDERPETAHGRILFETLLAIHAMLRRDLGTVRRLAADVIAGIPARGVSEGLDALRSDGLLWQFPGSCLRYCSIVHLHHRLEDAEFFGELEEANPEIQPVVARLRADHRAVSDHLDAVEAAARALAEKDNAEVRRSVAVALEVLEERLLAHLEYEERNIASTARRLPGRSRWGW